MSLRWHGLFVITKCPAALTKDDGVPRRRSGGVDSRRSVLAEPPVVSPKRRRRRQAVGFINIGERRGMVDGDGGPPGRPVNGIAVVMPGISAAAYQGVSRGAGDGEFQAADGSRPDIGRAGGTKEVTVLPGGSLALHADRTRSASQ